MALSEIKIGYVDAKTEVSEISDFSKYYYDGLMMSEKIDARVKYIITGRKGSGKTLLAYFYCEKRRKKNRQSINEVVSLKNITLQAMAKYKDNSCIGNDFFMWKWVVLIEYCKWLLSDQSLQPTEEYLRCASIIKELIPEKKTIFNVISSESGISLEVLGQKIGLSMKGQKEKAICNYEEIIENFEKDIIEIAISSKIEINIVFDDLDDKYYHEEKYYIAMKEFIEAVDSINEIFRKSEIESKILIVLRSDIFRKLRGPNIGKIKRDSAIEFDWTTKISLDTPVMKMMLNKVRKSLEIPDRLSDTSVYRDLFDEYTNGEPTFKYILNRTMLRPRDLVSYIGFIIEEYPKSKKINGEMVRSVERKYSDYLKEEIRNEMYGMYSDEYIEGIFSLLKLNKMTDFGYFHINTTFTEYKDKLKIGDLDEALNVMFNYSIIGNIKEGYGSPYFSFKYRDVDSMFMKSEQISVHPGLRSEIIR